jgi:hypothetical protein
VVKSADDKSNERAARVFVKDGFRSYRRTYRLPEFYWGLGTGAVLLGILGWVKWKGDNPDPSLFDMSAALQADPSALGAPLATSAASSGRGALPAALTSGGFREGKIGEYSADDLYVKIDGRAGFFQSFGVKSLHSITLEPVTLNGAGSEGGASIDIELYDMGESRNAIGAYNGERPPGIESQTSDGSTFHFDRNAGFLARGNYYARFIGSDESAPVTAEVRRLLELFQKELPAGEVPWAFGLFVDQLKLSPAQVTYVRNNAFSFGFARDVYTAALSPADSRDDMQAFVVATAEQAAAKELAQKFDAGFASLGAPAGKTSGGVALFKDEFLGSFSGATSSERWVVGVRGAPDAAQAGEILERLEKGLAALPPEVRARAVPSPVEAESEGDGYPAAASPPEPAPGNSAPGSSEEGRAKEADDEH